MKQETKRQIAAHLVAQANKGNRKKMAARLKISQAHVMNLENESKWAKVADKHWNRAALEFGIGQPKWQVVETNNLATIYAVCNRSRSAGRMHCVVGDTGYGKTIALKTYAKSDDNVAYVLCNAFMSPRNFVKELARAFGLTVSGSMGDMTMELCERILELDNPLIILDDLGKVSNRVFMTIHMFEDALKKHCGIVLAGVPYLRKRLRRGVELDQRGYQEFVGRIMDLVVLTKPTAKDIAAVSANNGVQLKESIKYLQNARTNYRDLESVIDNAKRLANGETVTREILERVNLHRI